MPEENLMARRRSRSAQADYGHYSVTVSASSAYSSHRMLDPKYDAGRDAASSTITIEGALDTPVIRRQVALVDVHCREQGDPGGALGVNDTLGKCWSISPALSSWICRCWLPRKELRVSTC
jgi:hypothetical protein